MIEQGVGPPPRGCLDVQSKRPEGRAEGIGKLLHGNHAVLRVNIHLHPGPSLSLWRLTRRAQERREAILLGLLGREPAVTVSVEAGMVGADAIGPCRAKRALADHHTEAELDWPGLAQDHEILRRV